MCTSGSTDSSISHVYFFVVGYEKNRIGIVVIRGKLDQHGSVCSWGNGRNVYT